jgi:hypothetical protein
MAVLEIDDKNRMLPTLIYDNELEITSVKDTHRRYFNVFTGVVRIAEPVQFAYVYVNIPYDQE